MNSQAKELDSVFQSFLANVPQMVLAGLVDAGQYKALVEQTPYPWDAYPDNDSPAR